MLRPDRELTGNEKDGPTWIQFENCRFRVVADPRKRISCDEYSGFEIRNCVVTEDSFDKKGNYSRGKTIMIRELIKAPKQMLQE